MFNRIVGTGEKRRERIAQLFCLHPVEIRALLELGWDTRRNKIGENGETKPGPPDRRSEISQLPQYFIDALFKDATYGIDANNNALKGFPKKNREDFRCDSQWDHYIYAYLIENTSVYTIFQRVLFEYLHGEKLGVPTREAQFWLRSTEELFYSNPAPFSVYDVVSHIRPDMHATRRNNYFRMFGIDLNHGDSNNKPYNFFKPEAANRDFVTTLEEFLQEVWVGIVNTKNSSGENRTDDSGIASSARQLHDMLNDRRLNGNIAREEFFAVAMMSWFHLTLEFDFPIIASLRAEGTREDQRLYRIAERVGVPAHAKSYDFFQLAKPMSRILTMIETGFFNVETNIAAFFEVPEIESDIRTIITHWGYATGRDMKVRRGANFSLATNNYMGYTAAQVPSSNGINKEFSHN